MILTGTVALSILRGSCSLPVMHPEYLDDNVMEGQRPFTAIDTIQ